MTLKCGLVGLPNCGKSTIFNALTGAGVEAASFPYSTVQPNVALVPVPDDRLDRIRRFLPRDRIIPAELEVVDIAGLPKGASRGEGLGNKFLGRIKEVEALVHVVRFFASTGEADVDPLGDIEVVETELALADLDTVERNLDRVTRRARSGDKEAAECSELYAKVRDELATGRQTRHLRLVERERALLRPMFLLTAKPVLYVANLPEDKLPPGPLDALAEVERFTSDQGAELLSIKGQFEAELVELTQAERAEFLADAGLSEPVLDRLIQKSYELLGLRTFFTSNEKEIRAWTFRAGETSPKAAGVIHTDFEKKFIRAQIYSVEDLEEYESEPEIKAAGRMRVVGKDYEMQDGDIAYFLIG